MKKFIVPLVMLSLILTTVRVSAEIKTNENVELSKIVSAAVCAGDIQELIKAKLLVEENKENLKQDVYDGYINVLKNTYDVSNRSNFKLFNGLYGYSIVKR